MKNQNEVNYVVVQNHEEQFSIWLANRIVPSGWRAMSEEMSKEGCLTLIEEQWTDLRPKSIR